MSHQLKCKRPAWGRYPRTAGRILRRAILPAVLLGLCAGTLLAQKPAHGNRMMRQIGVMEGIVDRLLLDSPNFLVSVGHNTRGIYLPEYGAIFTFEASLTHGKTALNSYLKNLGKRFEIQSDEDGNRIVISNSRKHSSEADSSEGVESPAPPKPPSTGKLKEKKSSSEDTSTIFSLGGDDEEDPKVSAKLYQAGKDELVQMLLDYGETMSQLKSGEWIVIAAFLDKNEFFTENNLTRLILRVKIDDLRDLSASKLTEDQTKSRIVIEEY
jgi:hypothetical protein